MRVSTPVAIPGQRRGSQSPAAPIALGAVVEPRGDQGETAGNRCCCPVTICGWGVREFSHPSRPCSRGRHNGSNFRDLLPPPAGKAGPADGSFSDAFGRSHRRQRRAFSSPFRRWRRSLCASCGPATSAPSRLVSLNKRSALGHAWLRPPVHRLRIPPFHSGDSTITRTRNV